MICNNCGFRPVLLVGLGLFLGLAPLLSAQDLPTYDITDEKVVIQQARLVYQPADADVDAILTSCRQGEGRLVDLDNLIGPEPGLALWLVFALRNNEPLASNRYLQFLYSNITRIRVFALGAGRYQVADAGQTVGRADRRHPSVLPTVPVSVEANQTTTVLVRINHGWPVLTKMNLWSDQEIDRAQSLNDILIGLIIGGLIILALYNLVIFGAIRETLFAWFVLNSAGLAAYFLGNSGYLDMLLLSDGVFTGRTVAAFAAGIQVTASVIIILLNYHHKTQITLPLRWLFGLLFATGPLLTLGISLEIPILCVAGGALLMVGSLLVLGDLLRKHGHSQVLHFVLMALSFICLVAGGTLSQPWIWGIDPRLGLGDGFIHLDIILMFVSNLFLAVNLYYRLQQIKSEKQEAELQARAKQLILASVSHEMRNPLAAIIGIAESIPDNPAPNIAQKLREKILQESTRLMYHINQILDAAQLEYGGLVLRNDPFSPAEVVRYLHSLMQDQIQDKGLDFTILIATHVPNLFVMGDANRFEQIIRNLLQNARKFTEKGSIRISLRTETNRADQRLVDLELVVEDTGIGISAADQARIFQEFTPAGSQNRHRFGGTGLGMSITKRLVQSMDGSISIASRLDQGSAFCVQLTLAAAGESAIPATIDPESAMEIVPPSSPSAVKGGRGSSSRPASYQILVVDDSDMNLDLCRLHLQSAGQQVTTAFSGTEALLALAEKSFDLIFLDLYLGDTTGVELLATIRTMPSASQTPVVGLTGATQDAEVAACLEAGMLRVLFKPVHRQDLIETVKEILEPTTKG